MEVKPQVLRGVTRVEAGQPVRAKDFRSGYEAARCETKKDTECRGYYCTVVRRKDYSGLGLGMILAGSTFLNVKHPAGIRGNYHFGCEPVGARPVTRFLKTK